MAETLAETAAYPFMASGNSPRVTAGETTVSADGWLAARQNTARVLPWIEPQQALVQNNPNNNKMAVHPNRRRLSHHEQNR